MKKYIYSFVAAFALLFAYGTAHAISVFTSNQVGATPAAGFVLQTNGTNSTWVATSTLGITGGGSGSTTPPGGLNTQVQYNNAGVFGGISGATTNGTILSLLNPLLGGATLTTSSVNGVTLTTAGSATSYLNAAGAYSVPPVGTNYWTLLGQQLYNNVGSLIGIGTTTPSNTLSVQSPTGSSSPFMITGNTNNFFQGNIQNLSSAAAASSDWVATANNGDDSNHYVDWGINGSGGGVAPFTGTNQGYGYSATDDLNLGALGATSTLKFFTTGGTTPVERARIDNLGNVLIGTSTANGLLTVAGTTTSPCFSNNGITCITGGGGGGGSISTSTAAVAGYVPVWANASQLTGTSSLFQLGNSISMGTTTPSGRFTIEDDTIASTVTATSGIYLVNLTPATSNATNAQKVSPAITWEGQGWKANATAGSQPVKMSMALVPVDGSGNPSANLNFYSSINGGALFNLLQIASNGQITSGSNGASFVVNGGSSGLAFSSTFSAPTSNFAAYSSASVNQTASAFLWGTATGVQLRSLFYGANNTALTAGSSYSSVNFGRALVTEAATGNHEWLTNVAVLPLVVTGAAATVSNSATLYVDSPASVTATNSSALYVGGATLTGTITNSYGLQVAASTGATNNYAASTTGRWNMGGLSAAASGNVTLCINATTKEIFEGGSATSCAPSTETVKTDIATSTTGIDELMALRPVTYWFTEGSETQQQIGLLAEEADSVDTRLTQKNSEGNPSAIRWDNIAGLVLKSIQDIWHHDNEQDARIAALEDQIAELNSKCVMK